MQRGFVFFGGDAARFPGWVSLTRSLVYEAGLGKVMSGVEEAPEPPELFLFDNL